MTGIFRRVGVEPTSPRVSQPRIAPQPKPTVAAPDAFERPSRAFSTRIVGQAIAELKGAAAAPVNGPANKDIETDPAKAAARVGEAKAAAADAREDYDRAQAKLDEDLAALPNLTPEQKQAYIEKYWKEAAPGVKEKYQAAEAQLASALEACRGAIEAGGDIDAVNALYEGYDELSHSDGPGHAQLALDFLGRVSTNPDLEKRVVAGGVISGEGTNGRKDAIDAMAGRALGNAQAEAIAAHERGDPSLMEKLADTLKLFNKARSLFNKVKGAFEKLAAFIQDPSKVTPQAIRDFAAEWGEKSGLGKALAAFAVAHAIVRVFNGDEDLAHQMVDLLTASVGGAEALMGALGTLGKALQGQIGGAVDFLGKKVLPVLTAVVAFADRLTDLIQNGGDGRGLAMFGAAVTAMGAGIGLVCPVVGVVFAAVGALLTAAGDWMTSSAEKQADEARRRQLMTGLGVPADLQDWMLKNPDAARALASAMGPERAADMQQLIRAHPEEARVLGERLASLSEGVARDLMARVVAGAAARPDVTLIDVLAHIAAYIPEDDGVARALAGGQDASWPRKIINGTPASAA